MYLVWINNREKKGGQVKRKVGLMSGRFPAVNRCRRRHHHHRATNQGCWSRDGGGVRGWAPLTLKDELTYSNQEGADHAHHIKYYYPLGFSDLPMPLTTALQCLVVLPDQ